MGGLRARHGVGVRCREECSHQPLTTATAGGGGIGGKDVEGDGVGQEEGEKVVADEVGVGGGTDCGQGERGAFEEEDGVGAGGTEAFELSGETAATGGGEKVGVELVEVALALNDAGGFVALEDVVTGFEAGGGGQDSDAGGGRVLP
jgi:hypothetical protein